jgi:cell division protein FtsW
VTPFQSAFSRADSRPISRWFWTIDRVLLALVILLVCIGLVLVLGASEPQVHRLAKSRHLVLNTMHFFNRQLFFALVGMAFMIGVSFLDRKWIRRLAAIALPVLLICVGLTLLIGDENKGAQRWLSLPGFDLQPSEFLKPCLAVVTAWILSARYDDPNAPAFEVSFALLMVAACLLIMQPDYGQTGLILLVWLAQAMLAGLSFYWIGIGIVGMISGLGLAYLFVPHVSGRLERFFNPESGDTYQIDKALDAFRSGGLFGVGPAEGVVKWSIPDSHTDYIFAVAGEEFGLLACIAIALLYLAIILRAAKQQLEEEDPFVFLAMAGLVVQFGAQAFINMGVNVALLPSKGMTLPFISYGGSSMLALSLGMGMILALSRRNRFLRLGRPARTQIPHRGRIS